MALSKLIAIGFILLGIASFFLVRFPNTSPEIVSSNEKLESHWTLPVPIEFKTLDPQKILSLEEKALALLTFSRLVKVNEDLQVEPDVVESWTFEAPKKTYTFHLKRDLKFHNGKPITTEDVLFSFHQWAKPKSLDHNLLFPIKGAEEYSNGKVQKISGLKAIDKYTFEIELTEWVDYFIRSLSLPRFCLYPKDFDQKEEVDFFKKPNGSGPYKVIHSQINAVEYEANNNYYFGKPFTPHITVKYFAEAKAREEFIAGRLDNLVMYNISNIHGLEKNGVVIKKLPRASTYVILFNQDLPFLRRETVRRTISNLIDKSAIITECFPGSDMAQSFIPPGIMGSFTGIRESKTPLSSQEEVLTRWGNQKDKLKLYLIHSDSGRCVQSALASRFKNIPIEIVLSDLNEAYHLLTEKKLFLWLESFEFKNDDPISNLQYFSKTSNEFLLGRPIPEVESLFKEAVDEQSAEKRAILYRKIDQWLVDHHYIVPIFYYNNYAVYRQEVSGLEFLNSRKYTANWHKIRVKSHASN